MSDALPPIRRVYGVDFSGARSAGRTTWVACTRLRRRRSQPLRLEWVENLEGLSGTTDRDTALRHLVDMVRSSCAALWAIDAPFGLPIEILDEGTTWRDMLKFVARDRRRIARDPGGDALDAVIAAVGAAWAWRRLDHASIARSARIRREGYLYF